MSNFDLIQNHSNTENCQQYSSIEPRDDRYVSQDHTHFHLCILLRHLVRDLDMLCTQVYIYSNAYEKCLKIKFISLSFTRRKCFSIFCNIPKLPRSLTSLVYWHKWNLRHIFEVLVLNIHQYQFDIGLPRSHRDMHTDQAQHRSLHFHSQMNKQLKVVF